MDKILQTRIRLKYDTYTAWQASEVTLLAGEIAIAVPGDKLADVATGTNEHGAKIPCLIKVGDGVHKFNELPWLSALAADVYSWAKKSEDDFRNWLTDDVNGPKLATKSELAELEGRVSGLEGKVKTIEESTIPGIVGRVETLESEMDTAQNDINNLKTKVGDGEGSLGAAIASLTTRVGNAEQAINDHASEYSALAEDVQENTAAITLLNNNKDTVGSVAYAVEQEANRAKEAEKTNSDAIAVLNGNADTNGSVASAVKTAIDQEVNDRNSAISSLKTELTTGVIKTAQDKADAAYSLAGGNKTKLDTLIGEDSGKSVRAIVNKALAAQLIPDNAAEALDTLQEIAAWIQSHPGDAAAMNNAINELKEKAHTHGNKEVLDGITAEKVTKWDEASAAIEGAVEAGIATLDYADTAVAGQYVSKVSQTDGVISVERTELPKANRTDYGMVKYDDESIGLNTNNQLEVKAVNTNTLFTSEGDILVFDCGGAN